MVESSPIDIKKLVNEIFAKKGQPKIENFAKEFADGSNITIAFS
jgi:hypothetical protein